MYISFLIDSRYIINDYLYTIYLWVCRLKNIGNIRFSLYSNFWGDQFK